MIVYESFQFAALPRTGTRWFVEAAARLKLRGRESSQFTGISYVPSTDQDALKVSLIRHPYTWLKSLYFNWPEKSHGMPDAMQILRDCYKESDTFAKFVDQVAKHPGCILAALDAYQASTVLRLEDFPWAIISLAEMLQGDLRGQQIDSVTALPPQNVGPVEWISHLTTIRLKGKILESEKELCERYDYV